MYRMQKYLHITSKWSLDKIIDQWYIDNSELPLLNKYYNGDEEVYWKRGQTILPIKWYLYNILKIKESWYRDTAPWEHPRHTKSMRIKNGILPKRFKVYDIENFRALLLDVHSEKWLLENYVIDKRKSKKLYAETASMKRINIRNPEEIDINEACGEILDMSKPYIIRTQDSWYKYFDYQQSDFDPEFQTRLLPKLMIWT